MTILLLAGSGAARGIAAFCADQGLATVASLAGATRDPAPLAVATRVGGFGGADGFKAYLAREGITRILDLTHPFAAQISDRSARIAQDLGLPYLRYDRPPWSPQPGDRWTAIADESAAAPFVPQGATVFLATGRQTLHRFKSIDHATLICRQIDPPDQPFPFPKGRFQIGRPPFSVDEEVALFQKERVDILITKNAGGAASRSKLDAARHLGLPVLMIARPQGVAGAVTDDLERVRQWLLDG